MPHVKEIAGEPLAEENARVPHVEEIAGEPLTEENAIVPHVDEPHVDEADGINATYGARTRKYILRKHKPCCLGES